MTHLYELSMAYKMLQDTEELTEEELATALANVNELFNEKACNIGKLALSLQADAKAIDTELERLSQRKQAMTNKVNWLKGYLAQEMEVTNTEKIKDELFTISLVSNPPSVQVDNEELIPADYWRIIPETKAVDKQTILANYKETQTVVPGVSIITDKKHILIK